MMDYRYCEAGSNPNCVTQVGQPKWIISSGVGWLGLSVCEMCLFNVAKLVGKFYTVLLITRG